jgi:hypothetical protein
MKNSSAAPLLFSVSALTLPAFPLGVVSQPENITDRQTIAVSAILFRGETAGLSVTTGIDFIITFLIATIHAVQ